MSADNRLKTSAALSKLWDNGEIRRVRGQDGSRLLFGRRLALHLMLQPKVSTKLLADPELKDQGLLSRILSGGAGKHRRDALLAGPETRERPRPRPATAAGYSTSCRAPLELAVGPDGQPIPNELALLPMELGPEARGAWIEFVDHIEGQIGPGGALAPVRGLASKAPEHAARIAAVLAVYDDHQRRTLPVEYVDRGIQLVGFYLGEALRLHGAAQVSVELEIAETTRLWLTESVAGDRSATGPSPCTPTRPAPTPPPPRGASCSACPTSTSTGRRRCATRRRRRASRTSSSPTGGRSPCRRRRRGRLPPEDRVAGGGAVTGYRKFRSPSRADGGSQGDDFSRLATLAGVPPRNREIQEAERVAGPPTSALAREGGKTTTTQKVCSLFYRGFKGGQATSPAPRVARTPEREGVALLSSPIR